MRMWGISPKFLCRAHLLGEHREMHCAYASVNSVFLIKGYCNGLVDFNKLKDRHDELYEFRAPYFMVKRVCEDLEEMKNNDIPFEDDDE